MLTQKRIDAYDLTLNPSREHVLVAMKNGLAEGLSVGQILDLLIAAAPGALDTLDELAAALGDDENFAATVTTALAARVMRDGSTALTGVMNAGGFKISALGDPSAGDDAATKSYVDALTTRVPAGTFAWFAANTPPTGWLECNGSAVSRSTYADLFLAINTAWGAGDGSTTFNLPDLRGEFVRGWDNGRGVDTSRAFASAQSDQNKAHSHEISDLQKIAVFASGSINAYTSGTALNTASSGGGEARPRNVAMLPIIKT